MWLCRLCVSDNHDIMALSTYDDLGIHPEADDLVVTPKFGTPPHTTHHRYRPPHHFLFCLTACNFA